MYNDVTTQNKRTTLLIDNVIVWRFLIIFVNAFEYSTNTAKHRERERRRRRRRRI